MEIRKSYGHLILSGRNQEKGKRVITMRIEGYTTRGARQLEGPGNPPNCANNGRASTGQGSGGTEVVSRHGKTKREGSPGGDLLLEYLWVHEHRRCQSKGSAYPVGVGASLERRYAWVARLSGGVGFLPRWTLVQRARGRGASSSHRRWAARSMCGVGSRILCNLFSDGQSYEMVLNSMVAWCVI
jgi:hypothetical protein